MLMRVAIGIHMHDIEAAVQTYHLLSERWFTHASPTLFNAGEMMCCCWIRHHTGHWQGISTAHIRAAFFSHTSRDLPVCRSLFAPMGQVKAWLVLLLHGKMHCRNAAPCFTPAALLAGTPRPQLSSCFLVCTKSDSIEGIYDSLKECAVISKSAGGIGISVHNIRATGSYIRGTNGTSNGIVPMLRVFNDTARYVDQVGLQTGYTDWVSGQQPLVERSVAVQTCPTLPWLRVLLAAQMPMLWQQCSYLPVCCCQAFTLGSAAVLHIM